MRAYIALGSNLGDRLSHLRAAVEGLPNVVARSAVYETEPVGGPDQPDFLNAVVALETDLTPRALLRVCQRLEQAAGRVRTEHWGPRELDVDILLMGEIRMTEPDLEIPHPRMGERAFVLGPLADVAPDLVDPETAAAARAGMRLHPLSL